MSPITSIATCVTTRRWLHDRRLKARFPVQTIVCRVTNLRGNSCVGSGRYFVLCALYFVWVTPGSNTRHKRTKDKAQSSNTQFEANSLLPHFRLSLMCCTWQEEQLGWESAIKSRLVPSCTNPL